MSEAKQEANNTSVNTPVRLNTKDLKTAYANVCTMNCNHGEVILNFGINQNFGGQQEAVTIDLNQQVILNPLSAKRMLGMLHKLIGEYEQRHGEIALPEVAQAQQEAEATTKQ